MTLLRKVRVLAAKLESTSGTAESLAAADGKFNAYNIEIQPTIEYIERIGQNSFSAIDGAVGTRGGTVNFTIQLEGDGSGGIPDWAETFLPACGMVATAQVYAPKSESAGSNVKTLTIGVYENGLLKMIKGSAGTMSIAGAAGKPLEATFSFTGVWVTPTDAAAVTPTYPSAAIFRTIDADTLIGGAAVTCWEAFSIDLANEVFLRPCADSTDGSGYSAAVVVGRAPVGQLNPEASLVAADPIYTTFAAGTISAFAMDFANSTDKVAFSAPAIQRTNVQEVDRGGVQADTIDFRMLRSAAIGDDELTITFSAP